MWPIKIISTKCGYIHDIHKMWIISTEIGDPQNADNIHDQNKITQSNSYLYHAHLLVAWHQHHITFTPWPRRVLLPTQSRCPLTRCSSWESDILHTTVLVLWACIVFIRRLVFKRGDTIFACRPLKIHSVHGHSHHSEQVPLLADRIFPPSSRQTVIIYRLLWDRSWRTSRTITIFYENRYLPYHIVTKRRHTRIQCMISYLQRYGVILKILLSNL